RFPDGSVVGGPAELGAAVGAILYGDTRPTHEVIGPFSRALSEWAGQPLRLVRADVDGGGIDRADEGGGFTIISRGSLAALAAVAGLAEPLDPRRFRMSTVIDGVEAYAEDGWLGRRVRLGDVVVEVRGNVGRCAVTTHDPDTGRRSLDTLELIARTRGEMATTEELPFGVWGSVVTPGRIRLGDGVEVLPDR
ncbi:MAG: MOSC domain-containing protein, partial [Candidatus Limnocylindrales bacterium]